MLKVLRPAIDRLLTPVGQALARTPVTPNALTVTGTLGVSAGALVLFPTGHLFAGTMVCTFFVFADMLDGTLARIKGTTGAWGAFLDSTRTGSPTRQSSPGSRPGRCCAGTTRCWQAWRCTAW